jgi:hypothetical protein
MTTTGRAAQGRSNNRRGQERQRATAAWLRESGLYPAARHVGQFPGDAWQSDLDRVGPRVAEVTNEPWDRLAAKLRQAGKAARESGVTEYLVWKHIGRGNNETGTVADSAVIMRAHVAWSLLAELDTLRAFAADHEHVYRAWTEQSSRRAAG